MLATDGQLLELTCCVFDIYNRDQDAPTYKFHMNQLCTRDLNVANQNRQYPLSIVVVKESAPRT